MDTGDLDGAERDFRRALEQARLHTFTDTRNELTVLSQYALGVLAWHRKDYAAARIYIQQARDTQASAGGNWVPDLERELNRIQALAGSPAPASADLR
jgi:hypothetical protein